MAFAEVLDKEPGWIWIWLIYGTVSAVGFLLCRRKGRWLALFLPLAMIVSAPAIGEMLDIGPEIYAESPMYYVQWLISILLAVAGPVCGTIAYLRLHPKDRLKTGIWTGVALLFSTLLIARAMYSGTSTMFLLLSTAKLTADRKPMPGWVHREVRGLGMIITRSDQKRRESYNVVVMGEKGSRVVGCVDWTAPRFPVVLMSDYNPPCLFVTPDQEAPLPLPERNLVVGPRFVEFTTDDGKRLRASW